MCAYMAEFFTFGAIIFCSRKYQLSSTESIVDGNTTINVAGWVNANVMNSRSRLHTVTQYTRSNKLSCQSVTLRIVSFRVQFSSKQVWNIYNPKWLLREFLVRAAGLGCLLTGPWYCCSRFMSVSAVLRFYDGSPRGATGGAISVVVITYLVGEDILGMLQTWSVSRTNIDLFHFFQEWTDNLFFLFRERH